MIGNKFTVDWSTYSQTDWTERVQTGVEMRRLKSLGERIVSYPADFSVHPRVAQVIANRKKMIAGELPLDWGCAETLAYASLLENGFPIRISGQDSGRGTFFHRHAVLHEQSTDATYLPLQHIADHQPRMQVIDSVLSEEAVMGFEYGYSTTEPTASPYGKASMVTSRTAPRSSLTSSSAPARPSGNGSAGWRCFSLTVMKAPGRSIPPRDWSASCSCAPNRTCRCACPRRPRRCFTCSAVRCCNRSVSRSS